MKRESRRNMGCKSGGIKRLEGIYKFLKDFYVTYYYYDILLS